MFGMMTRQSAELENNMNVSICPLYCTLSTDNSSRRTVLPRPSNEYCITPRINCPKNVPMSMKRLIRRSHGLNMEISNSKT